MNRTKTTKKLENRKTTTKNKKNQKKKKTLKIKNGQKWAPKVDKLITLRWPN